MTKEGLLRLGDKDLIALVERLDDELECFPEFRCYPMNQFNYAFEDVSPRDLAGKLSKNFNADDDFFMEDCIDELLYSYTRSDYIKKIKANIDKIEELAVDEDTLTRAEKIEEWLNDKDNIKEAIEIIRAVNGNTGRLAEVTFYDMEEFQDMEGERLLLDVIGDLHQFNVNDDYFYYNEKNWICSCSNIQAYMEIQNNVAHIAQTIDAELDALELSIPDLD